MNGDAMARAAAAAGTGKRIALSIEYDGTAYRGSQYQDNGPSIQSELEAAIGKLTGEAVRVAFAGRTDAGVHALAQVAAFDTATRLRPGEFVRGLNHFLPADIAVQAAAEVEAGWDPRRRARSRTYRYRIDTSPARSPLSRQRAWQIGRALDVEAMRRVACRLIGKHDFAAFAGPYEGSTERTLKRCDVEVSGCDVTVEMEAEAFLPHQVRRTVGPLAEVGLGRQREDDVVALLDSGAASPPGGGASAQPAAPACGLYLVRIEYDGFAFAPVAGNGQEA